MADQSGGWASPAGGGEPEPPRFGERVPGWTPPAAPAEQAPQQPPGAPDRTPAARPPAPTGYTPPPRPGLIPLHPLSFGQLLGAAFAVIRYNPRATIAPALIVSVLQSGLTFALLYVVSTTSVDRFQRATTEADRNAILAGAIGAGSLGLLLTLVVTVFGGSLLQGMLVTVVARGAMGERPTFGEALRAAVRRIWPLVGVSALLGAAQLVAILVLVLLVVGVASTAGTAGIVGAVLLAILFGAGYAVAYGFLAVKLATVPAGIVLEGLGVIASIGRSWRLTRGVFWRTFGLLALVTVMVSIAAQVVSLPFSVLGGAAGGLLMPNAGDDPQSLVTTSLITSIPSTLVALVVAGIGQIAVTASVVLVYLDRRMRVEGLDLELQRYAEHGGTDPFGRRG